MASIIPDNEILAAGFALNEWHDRGFGLGVSGREVLVARVTKGGLTRNDVELEKTLQHFLGLTVGQCALNRNRAADLFLYFDLAYFHRIPLAVQFLLDRGCQVKIITKLDLPVYKPGEPFDFNHLEEQFLKGVSHLTALPVDTWSQRAKLYFKTLTWYNSGSDLHLCLNRELWATPEGKNFHSLLLSVVGSYSRATLPKPLLDQDWFRTVCVEQNIIFSPLQRELEAQEAKRENETGKDETKVGDKKEDKKTL